MARTPSVSLVSKPADPRTAAGHASLAVSHSKAAAHHARRAETLSRDSAREKPKSKR
jgi:hypothetical protein